MIRNGFIQLIKAELFCLIQFFTSQSAFFSHVGTGHAGLNQHQAEYMAENYIGINHVNGLLVIANTLRNQTIPP